MKQKVLNFQGYDLSYLDNEKESAYTLVFLHGNSARKESFIKQFESPKLASFRMLALDLPGHGQSQVDQSSLKGPQIFSYDFYCQIFAEFLRELALNQVIAIGHSLGGHIAIGASSHFNYSAVVLSQTPPLEEISDSISGFNHELGILETLYNPQAQANEIQAVIENFTTSDELRSELHSSWSQTDPQFRINFSTSLGAPNFVPKEVSKLCALSVPWLILEAKNDRAINHNYFLERELLKNHMIELTGQTHFPHFEDYESYNNELAKFLAKLP